jgi:hypothetical protein
MDRLYIYDELKTGGTVAELSQKIKSKENKAKISLRIIDPNKGKSPAAVGKAGKLTDEFARYGIYFWAGVNDDIVEGHLAVKKYLKPGGNNKEPQMFIFNDCTNTVFGMTHYVWDDHKSGEAKDLKEKPRDKYKDFPDLVRYLTVTGPKYKSAAVSQKYQSNTLTGY